MSRTVRFIVRNLGPEGLDNYRLWLREGNAGSYEDYKATLRGEKGDQGDEGDTSAAEALAQDAAAAANDAQRYVLTAAGQVAAAQEAAENAQLVVEEGHDFIVHTKLDLPNETNPNPKPRRAFVWKDPDQELIGTWIQDVGISAWEQSLGDGLGRALRAERRAASVDARTINVNPLTQPINGLWPLSLAAEEDGGFVMPYSYRDDTREAVFDPAPETVSRALSKATDGDKGALLKFADVWLIMDGIDIPGVGAAIIYQDGSYEPIGTQELPPQRVSDLRPRSTVSESFTDVIYRSFYGQSLAVGAQGRPALSVAQPFANLTFSGGPRSFPDQLQGLIPLAENQVYPAPDGGTNRGETPTSGACNGVFNLLGEEDGVMFGNAGFAFLGSVPAMGGAAIAELDKASPWYAEMFLPHLQAAVARSNEEGKTCSVFDVAWIQGGTDALNGMTYEVYRSRYEQLINDVIADVRAATGQSFDPVIMSCQTSSRSRTNSAIVRAQWDVSKSDPRVLTVCPCYFLDYHSDRQHLTATSYLRLGYYFAKAWKRYFVDKLQWVPLSPLSTFTQGTIMDVTFNVPQKPLVMDDSLGDLTGKGFRLVDDGGDVEITGVAVAAPDRLRFVLSRPLAANAKLRYGIDYARSDDAILNGGAGCLRDSDATQIGPYALPNWCVQFELTIN